MLGVFLQLLAMIVIMIVGVALIGVWARRD
jgi:hypothetical protein